MLEFAGHEELEVLSCTTVAAAPGDTADYRPAGGKSTPKDVGSDVPTVDRDKEWRNSKQQPFKAKLSYYAITPCRASPQLCRKPFPSLHGMLFGS